MDGTDGIQKVAQKAGQPHLNFGAGPGSHSRKNQFVKPGFLDSHDNTPEHGDAMVQSQEVPRLVRLNPFVFPSNTALRFVVLIVSILASGLFTYNVLGDLVLSSILESSTQCVWHDKAIQAATHIRTPQVLDAASKAWWRCAMPFYLPHLLFLIGGVVLILGVAAVIYWLTPLWKLTRGRLVPLSTEDTPGLIAYLVELCDEVGLTLVPRFVWNQLNFTSSPRVFGRLGRYYIALTGGLVTLFSTDQAAFRVIMLHELAHLRNRDVNKTYFAIAVWWAFVAVALLPVVVIFLFQHALFHPYLILCIIALTILVYLSRNGVLRAREIYADVRASTWDSQETLIRLLQSLRPLQGWWQRLKSFHPDPQKRCQMVCETHQLFRVDLWVTFSLGIAIGVAFPNIEGMLKEFFAILIPISIYSDILPNVGISFPELAALGTAFLAASLIVGVVGIDIWRAAFAALAQSRSQSGLDRISLTLGAGLILGTFLSPSLANYFIKFSMENFTELFVSSLPWALLLLLSLILTLRWIATGAAVWLEIAAKRRSPRLISRTGLVIAGGTLTVWLTQLFLFRTNSALFPTATRDFAHFNPTSLQVLLTNTISEPASLLAFMSLWVFPLAAWFWHKGATAIGQPDWAFLDSSPSPSLNLPYHHCIRLPVALVAGLVGGVAFCGLQIMIQLWWHQNVPLSIRSDDQYISLFFWSNVALAALIQAGIASIIVIKVRKLGEPHGLFAAFIASIVMTIGFLGMNRLFGGGLHFPLIWLTLCSMINGGALLALPVTLIVSTVDRRIRKVSPCDSATP